MKKSVVSLALALACAPVLPAAPPLGAQTLPGQDWGSATIHLGVFSPRTTFRESMFGESWFNSGFALGASVVTWPRRSRWGLRFELVRSRTEGENAEHEFAPIAVNDPTQWIITGEFVVRHLMLMESFSGFPYVSAGVGGKQYNWTSSVHSEDRFFVWTAGGGFELRHRMLGPLALNTDLRGFFSKFKGFGIDDGTWEPGFYGGKVGGVSNVDLLFTTGLSLVF